MKVTPEDLYAWIASALNKLGQPEGKAAVVKAWQTSGYLLEENTD
jgi:hypothetical protein